MSEVRGSKWQITVQESQFGVLERMPHFIYKWGWQDEIAPTTQRLHRQGYVQTRGTIRLAQLKKALPGVHIELAKNWAALLAYCKKAETAVPGTQVEQENTSMGKLEFTQLVLTQIHERYNWRDFTATEILDHAIQLGNETILETGDITIGYILADPNFKVMVKQSGRAFLYSLRTDGRTAAE